ncbi:MAG: metal-dependent hydrolase [Bacteroidota bacterium]|jgi:inner membrane protein|nr:metal-dependent hydrolase [Bacteroidota bacterium]
MDSLTHVILGAAIGEAILGKKIGRKAMLWGALADTIPDFDVFASPCFSDAQQLLVHRGFTHSFLFIAIMSPFLGWLFSRLFKKQDVDWKAWTWLFFCGMFSHVLLDSLTAYGTGWFEPFSNYRVSFNTIFVADIFYTIPFLICIVIALIAKNGSDKRRRWTKAGLWISSLYLLFTILNKIHIQNLTESQLAEKNIAVEEVVTTPTALNNFLWMTYSKDATGYWFGYHSVFDKSKNMEFYHVNKKDSLIIPYENDESVQLLKRFSQGHYIMSKSDSAVFFNDIRFGQMGGWDGPDSAFVFTFKLDKNADNSKALDRNRFKKTFSEAISSLITRIKGV